MKIAIEAQRIFRPDKHGMDFVALETIRELQKRNDGNEYYIIVAPGKDHCLEESANLSIVEVACPTYPLWEQIALPLAVKRLGADLLHCTSNTAPLCCPVPLVLTLHDIIYLEPRQQRSPSLYQEMGRHYRRLTAKSTNLPFLYATRRLLLPSTRRSTAYEPITDAYILSLHVGEPPLCM